jgi:RimJ/RimL family protein N-acetyltransferase
MTWALDPIDIKTDRIHIRNYDQSDFGVIAKSIQDSKGWFAIQWGIDSPQKIQTMLASLLVAQTKGVHNALVYKVEKEVAGITRLMRLEAANKSLEIGGTWIAPQWRKTFVNTEVKFQLLQYCFETLKTERVELRVDARNVESQRAVLRLGAKLEGRLRQRQVYPDGIARDGFLFSVVRTEWGTVKKDLQQRCEDPSYKGDAYASFPIQFETENLLFRPYRLTDGLPLYELVERNRFDLWESFPLVFKEIKNLADTEDYILNKLHQWHTKTFFCYAIFTKATGEHIGQLHIKNIKNEIPAAELGYFLDINYRRKGFGTEILQKALHLCLNEKALRRVFIRILPTNQPSLRLAEKLNFEYEGLHRKEFITGKGELVDISYYSRS